MVSSNKLLLLSFAMKFLGKDDGLCEIAHWPAKAPAFTSQVEIGLLFGYAMAVLENPFCSFDDFSSFERAFHFQALRNEARILECKSCLSGDSLGESDFFRSK